MMKKIQIVWGVHRKSPSHLRPPGFHSFSETTTFISLLDDFVSFFFKIKNFFYWICYNIASVLRFCMWDFSSLTRDQIHITCIGRQS